MTLLEDSGSDLFFTQETHAGLRLDQLLALHYLPHYSRSYFHKLIEQQLVAVNDKKEVKKGQKISAGQKIEINFKRLIPDHLQPEQMPLNIIYEDERLLCLAKEAGIVVHPAPGHYSGTLVNGLLYYLSKAPHNTQTTLRPGIVHRLDKDTSGLMVIAKDEQTHALLSDQFKQRLVNKQYLAICLGNPGSCTVNAAIARHPTQRQKMAVCEGGRKATTHFKTLCTKGELSLVLCSPITGRTHQIRLHLLQKGTPLLGDALYGNSGANKRYHSPRQQLHAFTLQLTHPATGKQLNWQCTPPEDMLQLLEKHLLPFSKINI